MPQTVLGMGTTNALKDPFVSSKNVPDNVSIIAMKSKAWKRSLRRMTYQIMIYTGAIYCNNVAIAALP